MFGPEFMNLLFAAVGAAVAWYAKKHPHQEISDLLADVEKKAKINQYLAVLAARPEFSPAPAAK